MSAAVELQLHRNEMFSCRERHQEHHLAAAEIPDYRVTSIKLSLEAAETRPPLTWTTQYLAISSKERARILLLVAIIRTVATSSQTDRARGFTHLQVARRLLLLAERAMPATQGEELQEARMFEIATCGTKMAVSAKISPREHLIVLPLVEELLLEAGKVRMRSDSAQRNSVPTPSRTAVVRTLETFSRIHQAHGCRHLQVVPHPSR
jgi:hypothetical protein